MFQDGVLLRAQEHRFPIVLRQPRPVVVETFDAALQNTYLISVV